MGTHFFSYQNMPRILILLALIGIAIIAGIIIFSGLPAQDKRNYTEDEIRVIAKAFLDRKSVV